MPENSETLMEPGDESDVQITEYDITSSPNDFNVTTIINFIEAGAIILPPYQRNYSWDKKRASKLIESLILGLPVPPIFLYEEGRNRFAVLDGQQRLLSIFFFRKKRFPKKSKRAELRDIFVEKGVFPEAVLANDEYFESFNIELPAIGGEERSPLDGLNYDTLGEQQSSLNLRPVRCVIIKQNEPKDDNSSVYEIFDRLNTGGVNLKPQQIRANLYFSPFYQVLYEVNKDPRWRKFFGQEERDQDLRDVELLLRAVAMLVFAKEYRPSMTRFLNRFSNHAKKNFSADDVQFVKSLFDRFLSSVANIPAEAFKAADRFSIGIFESAFVGLCQSFWEKRDGGAIGEVATEKITALADKVRPFLQEGTTKRDNVLQRLEEARKIMA